MYDTANKKMYQWNNPEERALICGVIAQDRPSKALPIMAYANFKDDLGHEIYTGDVCEVIVKNEFLSVTKKKAIMVYVFEPYFGYRFILEEKSVLNGKVVGAKLLGNVIENPGIIKDVSNLKNDHQSIAGSY